MPIIHIIVVIDPKEVIKMNNYIWLYTIVILKNVITIICFTYLAIIFNHWWIILFSALFMTSITTNKGDDKNE